MQSRLGFALLTLGDRVDPLPTMGPLRLLFHWPAWLLCYLCVVAPSAFGGVLLDPGFEARKDASPWGFSGNVYLPTSWIGHSDYPAPYEGSRLLKLEIPASTVGSVSSASQSFQASGLQEWTFSGHMLNYDNAPMRPGSYGLLEIVFTGASFGEQRFRSDLYEPGIQASSTPDKWSFGSVSAVAPVGSEHVTFYVKHVQGEVPDGGTSVLWWDEMNATVLDPVPELASTGWVAAVIIGMAIGGRRLGNRRAAKAKVSVSL